VLFEDRELYRELHEEPIMIELQPRIVASLEHIYTHHDTKNIRDVKANEYIAKLEVSVWRLSDATEPKVKKHPPKR